MPALRLRVVALLAVVFVATAQAPAGARPTLDEWKEKKAGEAAAADAKVAKQKKMAAVDKVISMIEEIRTQLDQEGLEEAKTYDKFACFCKDKTAEMTEAIEDGSDAKDELEAKIKVLVADRDGFDEKIMQLTKEIAGIEAEMKAAHEAAAKALALYETNAADLKGAIKALEAAIKVLKASKSPSFIQLQGMAKTIRQALAMADALGLAGAAHASHMVASLLQQAPDVPMQDYDFHSDGIIETLEKLLEDFMKEKAALDEAEVERVKKYDMLIQELTTALKEANRLLAKTKKQKEAAIAAVAEFNMQLTTVSAQLLADQEYMMQLAAMCHARATTWDQRSKARAAELAALSEVLEILKGAVTEKTTARTIRLSQHGADVRFASIVANDESSMEAIEQEAEEAEGNTEAADFIQVAAQPRRLLASLLQTSSQPTGGAQEMVADLLRTQGNKIKSTLLVRLASQVAADPFAKVKKLIQELIERLLQEQANTANQKGWCDKAIGDATQKRDYAAEEIAELNAKMAELEAVRDKLLEELELLAKQIAELEAARAKAEKLRAEEKAENAATVEEAEAGLEAINMALDIITKFYKTAAKNTVLAQAPIDDAPDTGFKAGEAYTGAQGAATGVIGMMEVIKSDFERTISETEKAEKIAAKEHMDFMTATGMDLAEKTTAHDQKTSEKDAAVAELADADEKLGMETDILTKMISELLELQPACVDTGMSYEERVALREEEIEALKKALCILTAYADYGPDGAAESC